MPSCSLSAQRGLLAARQSDSTDHLVEQQHRSDISVQHEPHHPIGSLLLPASSTIPFTSSLSFGDWPQPPAPRSNMGLSSAAVPAQSGHPPMSVCMQLANHQLPPLDGQDDKLTGPAIAFLPSDLPINSSFMLSGSLEGFFSSSVDQLGTSVREGADQPATFTDSSRLQQPPTFFRPLPPAHRSEMELSSVAVPSQPGHPMPVRFRQRQSPLPDGQYDTSTGPNGPATAVLPSAAPRNSFLMLSGSLEGLFSSSVDPIASIREGAHQPATSIDSSWPQQPPTLFRPLPPKPPALRSNSAVASASTGHQPTPVSFRPDQFSLPDRHDQPTRQNGPAAAVLSSAAPRNSSRTLPGSREGFISSRVGPPGTSVHKGSEQPATSTDSLQRKQQPTFNRRLPLQPSAPLLHGSAEETVIIGHQPTFFCPWPDLFSLPDDQHDHSTGPPESATVVRPSPLPSDSLQTLLGSLDRLTSSSAHFPGSSVREGSDQSPSSSYQTASLSSSIQLDTTLSSRESLPLSDLLDLSSFEQRHLFGSTGEPDSVYASVETVLPVCPGFSPVSSSSLDTSLFDDRPQRPTNRENDGLVSAIATASSSQQSFTCCFRLDPPPPQVRRDRQETAAHGPASAVFPPSSLPTNTNQNSSRSSESFIFSPVDLHGTFVYGETGGLVSLEPSGDATRTTDEPSRSTWPSAATDPTRVLLPMVISRPAAKRLPLISETFHHDASAAIHCDAGQEPIRPSSTSATGPSHPTPPKSPRSSYSSASIVFFSATILRDAGGERFRTPSAAPTRPYHPMPSIRSSPAVDSPACNVSSSAMMMHRPAYAQQQPPPTKHPPIIPSADDVSSASRNAPQQQQPSSANDGQRLNDQPILSWTGSAASTNHHVRSESLKGPNENKHRLQVFSRRAGRRNIDKTGHRISASVGQPHRPRSTDTGQLSGSSQSSIEPRNCSAVFILPHPNDPTDSEETHVSDPSDSKSPSSPGAEEPTDTTPSASRAIRFRLLNLFVI